MLIYFLKYSSIGVYSYIIGNCTGLVTKVVVNSDPSQSHKRRYHPGVFAQQCSCFIQIETIFMLLASATPLMFLSLLLIMKFDFSALHPAASQLGLSEGLWWWMSEFRGSGYTFSWGIINRNMFIKRARSGLEEQTKSILYCVCLCALFIRLLAWKP